MTDTTMNATDVFALGGRQDTAGADPLPALGDARRDAIARFLSDTPPAELELLFDELNAIEGRIQTAVPTTGEGAIAQLQYLLDFSEEGWEIDEHLRKMVGNVIAYLRTLSAGGVA